MHELLAAIDSIAARWEVRASPALITSLASSSVPSVAPSVAGESATLDEWVVEAARLEGEAVRAGGAGKQRPALLIVDSISAVITPVLGRASQGSEGAIRPMLTSNAY